MQRIIVLIMVLIAFCGCANYLLSEDTTANTTNKNKNCLGQRNIRILQAQDDGGLAHLCPNRHPAFMKKDPFINCGIKGELVYLLNSTEEAFYDNQGITLPNNKCFVRDGVFKYVNMKDIQKTVSLVKIVDFKKN